jgi:small-conductance mechanosensitive channel
MPELSPTGGLNPSSASPPSPTIKEESPAQMPRPRLQTKKQQRQQFEKPKTSNVSKSKSTHNMVEKRYRNNLNSKITTLSQCIPNLYDSKESKANNKATILRKSIEYIAELEQDNKKLTVESTALRAKIIAFERVLFSQTMARMINQRNYQAPSAFV